MTQYLTRRIRRPSLKHSLSIGIVGIGDVLVLLLFTIVGLYEHGGYAWEMPMYTLDTFAPFLLAWILLAPIVGLYRAAVMHSARRTLLFVSLGWLPITLVGGTIRASEYFIGGAPVNFLLVYLFFGWVFVLSWRLISVSLLRYLGLA